MSPIAIASLPVIFVGTTSLDGTPRWRRKMGSPEAALTVTLPMVAPPSLFTKSVPTTLTLLPRAGGESLHTLSVLAQRSTKMPEKSATSGSFTYIFSPLPAFALTTTKGSVTGRPLFRF